MLNVASGAARVISNNATITGLPQPFVDFGNLIVFGVFPSIFLIAVGVILIGWFVLRFTVFGRFIYAIGTNEEAVRLSGHAPRFYKMAAFTISGLTAGVAAMVYLLRLNVGSPIAGIGYELNAIAAVIIGGTSFSGGKGSIIGTLVGACIIQVLTDRAAIVRRRRQRQADRDRHGDRAGGRARRLSRPVPEGDRVAVRGGAGGRALEPSPSSRRATRQCDPGEGRPAFFYLRVSLQIFILCGSPDSSH